MPASDRFVSFKLRRGESDLLIAYAADGAAEGAAGGANDAVDRTAMESAAAQVLETERTAIIDYATKHPNFLGSLAPLPVDLDAPPVVVAMLQAGRAADVGPMAAVAGALAEAVGRALATEFGLAEIVVENGGDLWLSIKRPLVVAVYAGLSSLSNRIGVEIDPGLSPCGLACSSGTVGPSISFGKANAAVVLASGRTPTIETGADGAAAIAGAVADAWATALGNRIKTRADLAPAVQTILAGGADSALPRPRGALAILADAVAAAGAIKIVPIADFRRRAGDDGKK